MYNILTIYYYYIIIYIKIIIYSSFFLIYLKTEKDINTKKTDLS